MLRLSNQGSCSYVAESMFDLWSNEMFTDVRLYCMEGVVVASKAVLAAHSQLLHDVLLEPDVHEVLLLQYSATSVRDLVGVLHGGDSLNLGTEDVNELIQTLGINIQEYLNILVEDHDNCVDINSGVDDLNDESCSGEESKSVVKSKNASKSTSLNLDYTKDKNAQELQISHSKTEDGKRRNISSSEENSRKKSRPALTEIKSSESKKRGRKPNKDSIKVEPGAKYKDRFVSEEELEDLCSPYMTESDLGQGPATFNCVFCNYARRERSVLIQHIAVQHMTLLTFKCNLCDHLGDDLYKMEKHMNGHGYTREKDKVGIYKLLTKVESNLEILEERFKPFSCEFCSKLLKSENEGRVHQEECGGGGLNTWYTILSHSKYQCKFCPYSIHNKTDLKSHLLSEHKETLPFLCRDCGDSFITSNMLAYHRKSAHKIKRGTSLDKKVATEKLNSSQVVPKKKVGPLIHSPQRTKPLAPLTEKNTRERRPRSKTRIGNYHLKAYLTYLPVEEAEPVLRSYYSATEDGDLCEVCQQLFDPSDIREHLLSCHLKLALYQCELCSAKLKDAAQYQEHIQTVHDVQEIKTVELPAAGPDTEFVFVEEGQGHQEEDEDTNIAFVIHQNDEIENSPEELHIEDEMKPNDLLIDEPSAGTLCSLARADELYKEHLYKPVRSKLHYCLLCSKEWSSSKFNLAKDHILDHFHYYLYQCDTCHMLFKTAAHLSTHKESENKDAKKMMIGDYHKLEEPVFIAWKEAKPIIDSYYRKRTEPNWKENGRSCCLLCDYSAKDTRLIRTHLLANHLRINVYKCQECGEELSLEADIKTHLKNDHDLEFEGLEKVVDPEYETTETEVLTEDIRLVELAELQGKKVSSAQGRLLRKMHVSRNAAEEVFECQLCGEKKDFLSHISDHVMGPAHLDVFIYRCAYCNKLFRNWSIYSRHRATHTNPNKEMKPAPNAGLKQGDMNITLQHHLIEHDLFVGHDEGMRIVREYMVQVEKQTYRCKLCPFQSRSQGVESHIFAKHLVKLYLYRCEECGKMFRYTRSAYKNHVALHTSGKLPCELCRDLELNIDKHFTKESLAAHLKRFHTPGSFECKVVDCAAVVSSAAHLRHHVTVNHSQAQQKVEYTCEICKTSFPRNFQLQTHLESCKAGRSRTLFRQHIADSLSWEGKGVYRCNLCGETFNPPRPTTSSLPLARKHLISVHNKTSLRKTKMSWTQGVEGLNLAKKAARRRRGVKEKIKEEEVEEVKMAVEEAFYVVPEQIPSSQEVVI